MNRSRAASKTTTPRKVVLKKSVPAVVIPSAEPIRDFAAEAVQTTLRKTWKGQQQDAAAFEKTQHGAMLDERAHVRETSGHRWTSRKTH
jgi:hypothetical protein